MCCLIHYYNASDFKCTKCMSLQTSVCWWFLCFIRHRIRNEQLCKLHVKCLQFCIRHTSYSAAVLGARVLVGAESRKSFMQNEGSHGTWKGCCKCDAGQQGGTTAFLQGRWGRMGAPLWWNTWFRQLEVLEIEKCLLILWEKANLNVTILLLSCWMFCYLFDTLVSDIKILGLPRTSCLDPFNDSILLSSLPCTFSCFMCCQIIKIAKPVKICLDWKWLAS